MSLADYGLEHLARELNETGARLARAACDAAEAKDPARPRFVIGVLGPYQPHRLAESRRQRPGFRAISFDELRVAYREAADGLIDGGADMLMVETVFDTLNAKAALFAIEEAFEARGARLPVMVSGTITDASGRTLSGQTAEAFWYSLRHAQPLAIGLNCALGAKDLRAARRRAGAGRRCLRQHAPNAGLPNAFGGYDETPEDMAAVLGEFARVRPAQSGRRLLRHDAGAHRGDRRSGAAACRRAPCRNWRWPRHERTDPSDPPERPGAAAASRPKPTSSTSASAPTSPAARSSRN